jgi:hypothetical protein
LDCEEKMPKSNEPNLFSAGRGMREDEWYARNAKPAPQPNAGIPADNHSLVPYVPVRCEAVTKAGEACRAPRVKSAAFCVGHLKVLERDEPFGH